MEVHAGREHMPAVVELLVIQGHVLGFRLFDPQIPVRSVYGDMPIKKQLQATTDVQPEQILGIIETARPLDVAAIPPPRRNGEIRRIPNGYTSAETWTGYVRTLVSPKSVCRYSTDPSRHNSVRDTVAPGRLRTSCRLRLWDRSTRHVPRA